MDYELFSFITLSLILGLIVCFLMIKKKILFASLILLVLSGILLVIKKTDTDYFNTLFQNISNIDMYIFIANCTILLICIIELLIRNRKKKSKKSVEFYKEIVLKENDATFLFNMLRIDVAYYDNDKKVFVLNSHFHNSLGLSKFAISEAELNSYLMEEDKAKLDNAMDDKSISVDFRLKTLSGYQWYECVYNHLMDRDCKVIYQINRLSNSELAIGNYKDLEKDVKELDDKHVFYGLILSNIVSVRQNNPITKLNYLDTNKEIKDKDVREVIIVKYITSILSGYLKDNVKVYHLANLEYAFLVINQRNYEMVERGLLNNNSEFVNYYTKMNNDSIVIKSKAGIVFSGFVKNKTNNNVIKIAFEMLQIASSPTYKDDYALYQSPDEAPKYQLKDMGIDLDNDLKKFLNKDDE